mmetsp:Transcript_7631/g.28608  ORF Transcript_7631/g.28608 Transcript_7631/m.28608 type:complete len:514 (-) Transcript_7631:382-1923(-)|eukprot:CAMPEP_0117448692 /NCGR_PEP_ID=MMETSP0759-20121206/7540_1 /TAXON_ID=63605 /ORGANISM="Percolomonas cosmopolitus, Strain WS" /LENGTH=513 /DNA_ID=CAMNT_0005241103 /DNA_START=76 /DNA_END=1617 /DNA_ORIENTATION=-
MLTIESQPIQNSNKKTKSSFSLRNYILLFIVVLIVISTVSVLLHSHIASYRTQGPGGRRDAEVDAHHDEHQTIRHQDALRSKERQYVKLLNEHKHAEQQLKGQVAAWKQKYLEALKSGGEQATHGALPPVIIPDANTLTQSECDMKISERLREQEETALLAAPVVASDNSSDDHHRIGVLVYTYKRAQYLERCLNALYKHKPIGSKFEIFVSQDGHHAEVERVVRSFPEITLWQKDHNILEKPSEGIVGNIAYYYIAQHYKFGLEKFFEHDSNFDRVVILEEDIEIAPDFFEYFQATGKLLSQDKSLFCVSAFNDNGMKSHVLDPMALYRSDFFPGLGWMMTREFWNEIKDKWPLGYWDDWLRLPENRKGRACIRPEISRTYTFGAEGVSQGQFFHQYLKNIHLTPTPINWLKVDLSYLQKRNYDELLRKQVDSAKAISTKEKDAFNNQQIDLKVVYHNPHEFDMLARSFKIMTDKKSGVPRGSYKGVVNFRHQRNQIFLVPTREDLLYSNSE